MSSGASDRVGALARQRGLITGRELERAREEAREAGRSLGWTLVSLGMVSERDVVALLAEEWSVPAADLAGVEPDPRALERVPGDFARKHLVLPLALEGRSLRVAMADPTDLELVDDLRFVSRRDVDPAVAGEHSLRIAVAEHYGPVEALTGLLQELESQMATEHDRQSGRDEEAETAVRIGEDDAPVVRLVDGILADAVRRGASDIHMEPYEGELRVRYRIDGILREIAEPPAGVAAALVSRTKILAELDIAERRVPQDGRMKLQVAGREVDFRVSTLPVTAGEKVVLRILDRSRRRLELATFGMEPKAEEDFLAAIARPHGMVLVTGPTGSGKTTTLYAALDHLNTPAVNIMTAEDPVEFELHGVNQVHVRPRRGLTFPSTLRAFLRQDPDILMVGEIRDLETGSIAVKAALTGHLVLSTLHTNDAASTITRLVDMGMEVFNVASAVSLITAQRLVRRICPHCSERKEYSRDELTAAGLAREEWGPLTFHAGRGCGGCAYTGYSGRQGLYEVLPVTPEIRELVLAGVSAGEIEARAVDEGMLTLRRDGLAKVGRGITTLEEVVKETAS